MVVRPPAWAPPEAQWVPLAPGVKWLLKRPDGAVKSIVMADVAAVMAKVYQGRASLEALGVDLEADNSQALSLDQIVGYSSVFSACLYARHCLEGWSGIDDPTTAQPLDWQDPDNVRAALIYGAPPEGQPLLVPFMAWVEGSRRPMAAEGVRLRKLAKDHWTGGAERCRACSDDNEPCAKGASTDGVLCPQIEHTPQTPEGIRCWAIASSTSGLWLRSGMGGAITGLDYRAALLAFEAETKNDFETADIGAAFAAFRAIEGGRTEAEAERAAAERAAAG